MKFLKIKLLLSIFFVLLLSNVIIAAENQNLIDIPTAAIVSKGNYQIHTRLYGGGGVLVQGQIGLMQRFNLGISYGAAEIIGQEDPVWNPSPAINIKYRLQDEQPNFPAIAIGYDAQGYGPSFKDANYIEKEYKRYRNKSKGFYLVMSKELKSIGGLGLHGGTNYSFEDKDDKSGNMFFGINTNVGSEVMLLADYDLALNDDNENSYGNGRGYLNAGIRGYFAPELYLEFDMLNLTENGKNAGSKKINRVIKICYTNFF